MSHLRQDAEEMEKEKDAQINDLKSQLEAEQNENADLKAQLEALRKELRDLNETMAVQDEEISKYKKDAENQKK